MGARERPPTPTRVDGRKSQRASGDGIQSTQRVSYCPPRCPTVCAVGPRWRRALLAEYLADPATRTFWSLCGLWGSVDLAEVIETAADAYGAHVVADALATARRWPSVVPHDPDRLAVLAAAWRHEAEGVSVDG